MPCGLKPDRGKKRNPIQFSVCNLNQIPMASFSLSNDLKTTCFFFLSCSGGSSGSGPAEGLRKESPYHHPALAGQKQRLSRDVQPDRPRSLYPPAAANMQHPATSSSGYVPYSRPPAPLPEAALAAAESQHPASPQSMSWQWPDASGSAGTQADEEETHYASQLRSSMAALLQGHIRQSSTASNASSTFSSYSDEFRSPVDSAGALGIPAAGGNGRYGSNPCGPASESGYETYADAGGCYGSYNNSIPVVTANSSPPPPPPPVRDASSLKYVKYGPGHEKHPSWPMPNGSSQPAPGSQRSKSWTEQTDYPKEPAASYARPVPSVRPAYSQQLKTVMENCERIPPEVYQATGPTSSDMLMDRASYGLPSYDCDGRNIDDKDYTIPSPPERDISGPRMTYPGTGVAVNSGSTSDNGGDYAKYDDIQQYSHSEGYSSYVPSESSYVSVSGTPLLDQLRRDSDGNGNDNAVLVKEAGGGRDSVSTVVTHSSSNSSNETLRWHGSYSDISVLSSAGGRHHHQSEAAAAAALVVHSAKVQAPQRHNSESVLYYEQHSTSSVSSSGGGGGGPTTSGVKTINRMGGWSQRVERKNQWNSSQCSKQQPALPEEPAVSCSLSSGVDAPAPLSVAERIHQLEWQSRSVPNLTKGMESPQRSVSARPTAGLSLLAANSSSDPVSPSTGGSRSSSSSSSSSSGSSPEKESPTDPLRSKYTFLDPDKRMRVADPTLKAIQKQALLSYYERHAGRSSNAKSPPPPALPRTMASSSSSGGSPTHPAKVTNALTFFLPFFFHGRQTNKLPRRM